MTKQFLCLPVLIFLLATFGVAQKNKSNKNEQKTNTVPQVTLDQSLNDLSRQISDELAANQKTAVAVTDFVDLKGEVSDLGRFLAEELVTRLYKTKKLEIVERQLLNKVIAEQKLSLTDIIEVSSAKRIGRILGVDAIVSGTISSVGSNFRINARIINTETGKVLSAAAVSVPKSEEICTLVNCGGNPISSGKTEIQTPPTKKTETAQTWKNESNFFIFELKNAGCRERSFSAILRLSIPTKTGHCRL